MKIECKILKPLGIVERESTAVYPVDPPFLAKALLLLDENMERPVSTTALAKAVGVSSSTLRARAREITPPIPLPSALTCPFSPMYLGV